MENIKSKNWVMVLYPDDPTHVECISRLENGGYSYCGILHTEDIYSEGEFKGNKKKPHWHIVLTLKNQRYRNALSGELGIKDNYLEVCRSRDEALRYLVHYGYPEKYQYDNSELFGPLAPGVPSLMEKEDECAKVLHLLDLLDSLPVPCTYKRLLIAACNAGLYAELRRMGSGAMRLLDEHNAGGIAAEPLYCSYESAVRQKGFREFASGYEAGLSKK